MRQVDPEVIKLIKTLAINYVTTFKGSKDRELFTRLIAENVTLYREDIERAIAELVQEGLLMRIEYNIPIQGIVINAFYLPANTRIIS